MQKNRAPFIQTEDGTQIAYRDWGSGSPVVLAAAWGQCSDAWQYLMLDLNDHGLRCIAHDRRGHGRSTDPGYGFDFDHFADDLAALINHLDLRDITLVGHSMGCGEIVRYLSRHGDARVARIALLTPTMPYLLKTSDNPQGLDRSVFDGVRSALRNDLPKMCNDLADGYFDTKAFGTSPGMMQWTIGLILRASLKALHETVTAYSETDHRSELRRIAVPGMVIHGAADDTVAAEFGRMTADLIPDSIFKEYEDAPHGLVATHRDRIVGDLFSFIRRGRGASSSSPKRA